MTQPLFTAEGPEYYAAAYAHNAPFSRGAPYRTRLTADEEGAFQRWVQQNRVPFDPNAAVSDYDMRGYWKANQDAGHAAGSHFPDTYKTPYDTTFSAESMYAVPGTPFHWQGDELVDARNGQVIYAERATKSSGYGQRWHAEAQDPSGSRRPVELRMLSDGGDTHWQAQLKPGENLVIVDHTGTVQMH